MVKRLEIVNEIAKLKAEKNAIILAHFYQTGDIQDIADFVGDSLALSQKAASNNASIILFAGVKFMAETAKILAPEKKVLLPDFQRFAACLQRNDNDQQQYIDDIERHHRQNERQQVLQYRDLRRTAREVIWLHAGRALHGAVADLLSREKIEEIMELELR